MKILSDPQVWLSSNRKRVLGIIDYPHCYLAVSSLKVETLDYVKWSGIFVSSEKFKIQKQSTDPQEA